ncbi:DUF4129 domain-containing protein [Hymenobacter psychrophilus]|uniref:Protein-glutamine gamma-glutamyltransferase-like C-terminal domain-containing protein n=1 Tax=Hymenobacter psychrophilus TaxID=651662 RepID=A0A1H3FV12_9BACT|nr:DUF4129 domain-containing protein [Hymenobacter psychrophilus]SDX94188.1 protein of unknown function [Hymenobacter psychrophilus]
MPQLFFLRCFYPALLPGLLGLVLLAPASGRAQAPPRPPILSPGPDSLGSAAAPRYVRLRADTTPAGRLRRPAAERLAELRRQSEFQYVEPEPAQSSSDSLWSRFWRELWRRIAGLFSGKAYETRGRYVVYALFAAAFGYLLLRLLRLDVTGLLGRRSRALPLPYEALAEDIRGIDFAAALARAEQAGNYRLALRLGYLQTLRHLTDRNLIQWQPDKTNHDYLRELAGTPQAAGFRTLTRQFEYVWYGELPLAAEQYPALREQQQGFIRQLISSKLVA